ncbi:MAG TPA: hypothetical protein DCL54_09885, partial [Alphaproteobacteria bacterium]|nr:hypothetical protein [Alphaproteobacteria bacterium]
AGQDGNNSFKVNPGALRAIRVHTAMPVAALDEQETLVFRLRDTASGEIVTHSGIFVTGKGTP